MLLSNESIDPGSEVFGFNINIYYSYPYAIKQLEHFILNNKCSPIGMNL